MQFLTSNAAEQLVADRRNRYDSVAAGRRLRRLFSRATAPEPAAATPASSPAPAMNRDCAARNPASPRVGTLA